MTDNQDNQDNQVRHNEEQSKEELAKILERINFWISNCDTKISFALAFAGVLLAGFFSSSIITGSLIKLLEKTTEIYTTATYWEVRIMDICIFVLILFIAFIIISVTYLFRALKGSINTSLYKEQGITTDSLIFFGTIANQTYQSFKENVNNSNESQLKNDLLSQIYINSKICDKKLKSYNIGVNFLFASIVLFILLNILFLFIK
ncbi:Pycsar system effector family protein [Viridibacillus arvi]|uniref:Pycsar system effector family protein n=1 Tax=Viridibacillus arvi TaxID=263475 RepID=UPI0034CFCE0C